MLEMAEADKAKEPGEVLYPVRFARRCQNRNPARLGATAGTCGSIGDDLGAAFWEPIALYCLADYVPREGLL